MANISLKDITAYKGRLGIALNYNWNLADWEWDWIAATYGWVRIDAGWNACELTDGVYTFDHLDRVVDEAEGRGMKTLIILDYANLAAHYADFYDASETASGYFHGPNTEAQISAFEDFADAIATYYAGRAVAYEVWNEPHNNFWQPRPNAADYATFARRITKTVKEAAPDAIVIAGGGIALPSYSTWVNQYPLTPTFRPAVASDEETYEWYKDFAKQVADFGALTGADAYSFHLYNKAWTPEIAKTQIEYAKTLTTLPVVSTEGGIAAGANAPGEDGAYSAKKLTYNHQLGETERAKLLVRKALVEVAEGLPLTVLFNWRESRYNPSIEAPLWAKHDTSYFGQYQVDLWECTFGMTAFDPDDGYVDDREPEYPYAADWVVDEILVADGGSGYARPVPPTPTWSGAAGCTVEVATAGGKLNDAVITDAGAPTFGATISITDPGGLAGGQINVANSSLWTGVTGSAGMTPSIVDEGVFTAPTLTISGSESVTDIATVAAVAFGAMDTMVKPGGVAGGSLNAPVGFEGGIPLVRGWGYVREHDGTNIKGITMLCGYDYTEDDLLSHDTAGADIARKAGLCSAGASGLTATVPFVDPIHGGIGGATTAFEIVTPGSGYAVGDIITFTGGTGHDAVAVVREIDANTGVETLCNWWGGLWLDMPDTMELIAHGGTEGTGTTLSASDCYPYFPVGRFQIVNDGDDYPGIPAGWVDYEDLNTVYSVSNNATGGTFTLTYSGQTTSAIAYDATAATIQTALENLSTIDPGEVCVVGGPLPSTKAVIHFIGDLGGIDLTVTGSGASLTGAGAALTLTKIQTGGTTDEGTSDIQSNTYPTGARCLMGITNEKVTSALPDFVLYYGTGYYATKIPNVKVLYGPSSIMARARVYAGSVTEVFIDGPGVGLNPGQGITATLTGGKVAATIDVVKSSPTITITEKTKGDGTHDEVQNIAFSATPTAGSWTLSYGGDTSGPLYATAAAADVQYALTQMASIGANNATVTGSIAAGFDVTFVGAKAKTDIVMMTATTSSLWRYAVTPVEAGSSYEVDSYVIGTHSETPTVTVTTLTPGDAGHAEVQVISFSPDAGSGHFHLTMVGKTTGELPYNATAAQVETALDLLDTITEPGVTCTDGPAPADITVTWNDVGARAEMTATSSLVSAGNTAICSVDTVDSFGQVTAASVVSPGTEIAAYPAGTYRLTLEEPGTDATLTVKLKPKPRPRQPYLSAIALRNVSEALSGYHWVCDADGKPINLSTEEGVYHMRLRNERTKQECRVIWCRSLLQATAHATLDGTTVKSITLDEPGAHYDWTPTVTISGGGGVGATAVPVMFDGGTLSAIAVSNAGSGYTSVPTVTVEGFTPTAITLPVAERAMDWKGAPVQVSTTYTPTEEPVFVFLK